MNTILKYPGGKARTASWIISYFPPHSTYCEPFFGSGAVFFQKSPVRNETINDIDGDIVELFRVCRDYPEELARAVAFTPWARDEFMNAMQPTDGELDPIERARRTLIRYHQSYATMQHSKHTWKNVQVTSGPCAIKSWSALPDIVHSIGIRLKAVQIENCDALDLIRRYDDPDTLLYLDPPYPLSLRTKNMYQNEMTDEQHLRLLELVKESNAKIVLSSYDNEMYNDALHGWAVATKSTTAQSGARRVEKIYMNYQPPILAVEINGKI